MRHGDREPARTDARESDAYRCVSGSSGNLATWRRQRRHQLRGVVVGRVVVIAFVPIIVAAASLRARACALAAGRWSRTGDSPDYGLSVHEPVVRHRVLRLIQKFGGKFGRDVTECPRASAVTEEALNFGGVVRDLPLAVAAGADGLEEVLSRQARCCRAHLARDLVVLSPRRQIGAGRQIGRQVRTFLTMSAAALLTVSAAAPLAANFLATLS